MNKLFCKSSLAMFASIAIMSLASSCAKEGGNGADAVLSFSADTPELVEVKAAAVTSVSDFYTIGYAGTTQWFPTSGGPQRVQISGGSATFDTYKWKLGDSKTFYAYSNNLPTGATATIANSGVTLTYTAIPTEASAQNDVTLGRYSGNGDNKGEAALTFYHPLAQVVFKMGDMVGVSKIDKIEIKDVYSAGTTTLTTSTTTSGTPAVADFSWTGISGSATVSQTVNSLPSKGSEFGVPFMLIPQNLATQNVTVSVTVTTAGGSSVTLTKKLTSGSFVTGKKTVCTLTVNPVARELICNLAAYTADAGDNIFQTGPDPALWANLGMVSENGHPLYVSRRPVKRITVDGDKHKVEFTDNETDCPLKFSKDESYNFYDKDDYPCSIISAASMIELADTRNFTIESNSETGTRRYTSKITGDFIDLIDKQVPDYPEFSVKLSSSNNLLFNDRGFYSWGQRDYYCTFLVYEDLTKTITFTDAGIKILQGSIWKSGFSYTNFDNYLKNITDSNIFYPDASGENTYYVSLRADNGYYKLFFESMPGFDVEATGANTTLKFPGDQQMGILISGPGDFGKIIISFDNGTTYTFDYSLSCFLKGTKITLADGTKKKIEDITYDDDLKVWNFDKGCYDSAKPFWITKAGQTTEQYYRMTFSDGTVLNILGPQYKSGHKLYNYTDRRFEGVKTLEVGKEVYTENGVVTLVSKEEVNEEVEFYCLMTEDHLNCFAEGVLASLRYNNIYPFDENMKFIKDGRSRRPYKEFKAVGISREWYNGLRLGEQTDDLDTIKKYVDRYDAQTREKPAPTFWQKLRTWWKSIFG